MMYGMFYLDVMGAELHGDQIIVSWFHCMLMQIVVNVLLQACRLEDRHKAVVTHVLDVGYVL